MKRALLIIALTFIFIAMEFYNADRLSNTTVHDRLKYSLNRAAHDAALQVDPVRKVEGEIVFQRDLAYEIFQETLAMNLRLKPNLMPQPNNVLKNQVEIIFEDYIDDQSGVSFPYNYQNSQYGIYKTIEGPAVIFEVRVKAPKTSTISFDGYITKNVIQEYVYPR